MPCRKWRRRCWRRSEATIPRGRARAPHVNYDTRIEVEGRHAVLVVPIPLQRPVVLVVLRQVLVGVKGRVEGLELARREEAALDHRDVERDRPRRLVLLSLSPRLQRAPDKRKQTCGRVRWRPLPLHRRRLEELALLRMV